MAGDAGQDGSWFDDQVHLFRDVAEQLNTIASVEHALTVCCEAAVRAPGIDGAGAYSVDAASGTLELVYAVGLSGDFQQRVSRLAPDSPQSRMVQEGKPFFLQEGLSVPIDFSVCEQEGLILVGVYPITLDGHVVAVLNVASRRSSKLDYAARTTLEVIALQAGGALARLQALERSEASELRYRGVYEAAPLAFVVWDRQFRVIDWNAQAEKLFGWRRSEVLGQCFFDFLLPASERLPVQAIVDELLEGRLPPTNVNKNLTKSGRIIEVEWNNAINYDSQGGIVGGVSLGLDITERLEAEEERRALAEQVQQSQKLESLGVLAGGIAHDFNNLLVGILGNAELVRMDMAPDHPAHEEIEEIEVAARRAAELCRQMLAYSGKGRFLVEKIALSDVIEEMMHLIEASVAKRARLRCDFAANLPRIEADVTQLRQVIMNLIINAAEAMDEGDGRIDISTGVTTLDAVSRRCAYLDGSEQDGPAVFFEVADNGKGMDEATRAKVFEPFFSTKFTGRGLGLAAVLGIVRGHHGALFVESKPGEGSVFRVVFPIPKGDGQEPENQTEPEPTAWRSTGTVLLVDDEPRVRQVARRYLNRLGFEVLTARDGHEALHVYASVRKTIRCVLLDMTMPSLSGRETLTGLRAIDPEATVILCSGYAEPEKESDERFQPNAFIQKPYRMEVLASTLRQVLETRQSARDNGQ